MNNSTLDRLNNLQYIYIYINTVKQKNLILTSTPHTVIILFANDTSVFKNIKLIPSIQLPSTHVTREAVKMVHVVLRSSHYLFRVYDVIASSTLWGLTS